MESGLTTEVVATWNIAGVTLGVPGDYPITFKAGGKTVQANLIIKPERPDKLEILSVDSSYSLQEFTVRFNDDVDPDTILKNANIKVDGKVIADTFVDPDIASAVKVFLGFTPTPSQSEEVEVKFTGVASANDPALTMADAAVKVTLSDKIAPTITKAEIPNPKTIEFTFSEAMNFVTPMGKIWDEIKVNGVPVAGMLSKSGNSYTFIMYTALTQNSVKLEVSGFRDYASFLMDPYVREAMIVKDDPTPPDLIKVEMESTTRIKLTYSKPVVSGVITVDGVNYSVGASPNGELTSVVNLSKALGVGVYSGEPIGYENLKDIMDNSSGARKDYILKVTLDTSAPQVTLVRTGTNALELTFSKPMLNDASAGSIALPANYALLSEAGSTIEAVAASVAVTSPTKVTVLFNAFLTPSGVEPAAYTLRVTNLKEDSVIGLSLPEQNLRFNAVDTKVPSIVSIMVIDAVANTIRVVFDKPMVRAQLENRINYVINTTVPLPETAKLTASMDRRYVDITLTGTVVTTMFLMAGITDDSGRILTNVFTPFPVGVAPAFGITDILSTELTTLNEIKMTLKTGVGSHVFDPATAGNANSWKLFIMPATEAINLFVINAD
ncbi:MAG: hypothetical protein FWE70_06660, partial [Oscillospiraceae bacterium]|nr:hypothetical protein [Oscillospiraceae bacterium]